MTADTLTAPPAKPGRRRRAAWWAIPAVALALAVLAFMLTPYIPPDIAGSRADMHGDRARYALLIGHIAFGTVAVLTGLLQFWPRLRARRPRAHRWTGRAYFYAGIFPAAALALPVTALAEQGVSNQAALLATTVAWTATGIAGLRAARSRRFGDHRRWMIRNYAITMSILASRLWAGPLFALVVALGDTRAYQGDQTAMIHDIAGTGAWLGLLANLLVAELIIRRRRAKPAAITRATASAGSATSTTSPPASR